MSFFDKLFNKNLPTMQGIQLDSNGLPYSVDVPPKNRKGTGLTLAERLFGERSPQVEETTYSPQSDYTDEIKQKFNEISDADIQNIQQGLNVGNKDYAAFINEKGINKPSTADEINLAKEGKFNVTPDINVSISENPRVGGILPDISNGFKENFSTGFAANNLQQNDLPNNRNKGIAFRIGEGLGSVARFADSPLGRMAITAGAIGAFGGSPLEMAAYGAEAGVGNQQNRMKDKMYRQSLEDMGLDTSNIRGYIGDNAYKNYALANYRNRNLDVRLAINNSNLSEKQKARLQKGFTDGIYSADTVVQALSNPELLETNFGITDDSQLNKSNASRNADMKEELLPYQKYALQTAPQVALGNLGLNAQRLQEQISQDNFNNEIKLKELQQKGNQGNEEFDDIRQQLDNFSQSFKTVNNPYRYRTVGWASNILNTLTNDEANFNAQRTLLFNQIARKLGGEKGVLSDNDIKRIEAALPTLLDNMQQKQAKMKAVYSLLDIKTGNNNINVDRNKLEEEMKKRGLK